MKADPAILPSPLVSLCVELQHGTEARLGGGAALAGYYLGHRHSDDLDLFFHDRAELRTVVITLGDRLASHVEGYNIVQDAGGFVRVATWTGAARLKLDLVYDPMRPLSAPVKSEDGVLVESFRDLVANKITCLLSRSEPRDLVDCLFIERRTGRLEDSLADAAAKDAGIDPATLAWLLRDAILRPLPRMVHTFDGSELDAFRDLLVERLRRLAVPSTRPAT